MVKLHTPEEAAEQLRCTESWLKERARRREIPFSLIGGQYRFSDAHLDRIVALFEQQPEPAKRTAPRRPRTAAPETGTPQLHARPPRRLRATG